MKRAALAVLATLAFAGCGDDDDAPTPPDQTSPTTRSEPPTGAEALSLERVGSFEQPVHVAQPGSDREHLYVVERCGRVMRVPAAGAPSVFLDLSDSVGCDGTEQGLLSIAFDPDYARSGRLYVYFTDPEGDARVVEYRRAGEVADLDSARELLRIADFAANHNGGQLAFGPDGLLYVGTGDGGGAGDPERTAQDPSSLLGKILRIDAGAPAPEPEIVASGLRNPWRFSFDRRTADLWIGDVGQSSLEEIDAAPASAVAAGELNFGWSAFEGGERFNTDQEAPGAIAPVLEYPLVEGNCAVTGGYVVRDRSLGPLAGRYLYGDYCAGELRSFTARSALRSGSAGDDSAVGLRVPALSSFGEDAAGRVYAVSLEGPVYRLVAE